MKYGSHSQRLTSECLFVTACSMDEYVEEKRTEKNLILRIGISEAETTNNKRLRSTFCIEVIQTRSITRPLCDSRASCPLRHIETENFQPHARPWSLSAHHMRLKLEGDHEAAVMIVHRKC